MVPTLSLNAQPVWYSPRIRGDGPLMVFPPRNLIKILPVFAGMVPRLVVTQRGVHDSPRIRGDGPELEQLRIQSAVFSPYSRGWSP